MGGGPTGGEGVGRARGRGQAPHVRGATASKHKQSHSLWYPRYSFSGRSVFMSSDVEVGRLVSISSFSHATIVEHVLVSEQEVAVCAVAWAAEGAAASLVRRGYIKK